MHRETVTRATRCPTKRFPGLRHSGGLLVRPLCPSGSEVPRGRSVFFHILARDFRPVVGTIPCSITAWSRNILESGVPLTAINRCRNASM